MKTQKPRNIPPNIKSCRKGQQLFVKYFTFYIIAMLNVLLCVVFFSNKHFGRFQRFLV